MGYPVVINGYHLKPSQLPFRKSFKENASTPAEKIKVGGYKGYINNIWGASKNFDVEGKRAVRFNKNNLPPEFAVLKDKGWHLPLPPRDQLTFRQMAMKVIGNTFNRIIKDNPAIENKSWMVKCIPRLTLFSLAYSAVVDKGLLDNIAPELRNEIKEKAHSREEAWNMFNSWKQANKQTIKNLLEESKDAIFAELSNPDNINNLLTRIGFYIILEQDRTPDNDQFGEKTPYQKALIKAGLKKSFTAELAALRNVVINLVFEVEEEEAVEQLQG